MIPRYSFEDDNGLLKVDSIDFKYRFYYVVTNVSLVHFCI